MPMLLSLRLLIMEIMLLLIILATIVVFMLFYCPRSPYAVFSGIAQAVDLLIPGSCHS